VDFLAVVTNFIETGLDTGVMGLLNILSEEGLVLALVEGLYPSLHDVAHLAHVLLHLLDKLVNFSHDLHGLVDKGVNVVGVPLQGHDTGVKGIEHLLDAGLQQGLLDNKQGAKDIVVHVNGQLKVAGLGTVHIDLLVESRGAGRHLDVNQLQVLDFAEKTHEGRVEVNADEAFGGNVTLFADEQELVKVLLGVVLDRVDPRRDLLLFEFLEALNEGLIQLLHILVLLTLLDGL
jgi:hypothetical protein